MRIFRAKYRAENSMKRTNMSTYTIKKDENSGILLLGENGEAVSGLDLLREIEPYRVIAFEGQMGAGKTTFIKKLCEDMQTVDVVNSPTFAIVNVYDVCQPYQGEVYHFDCYRLKDVREAMDLGAEEYLYSGNYCFIEWPELIEPLLPNETVYIHITPQPDGSRLLTLEIPK